MLLAFQRRILDFFVLIVLIDVSGNHFYAFKSMHFSGATIVLIVGGASLLQHMPLVHL